MSTAAKWGIGAGVVVGLALACYFGGCEAVAGSAAVRGAVAVATPIAAKTASWAVRAAKAVNVFTKNTIRVGNGRVSIGPAPKAYGKLGWLGKSISPLHVHIEPKKIWFDFNWINKGFSLYRNSKFKR